MFWIRGVVAVQHDLVLRRRVRRVLIQEALRFLGRHWVARARGQEGQSEQARRGCDFHRDTSLGSQAPLCLYWVNHVLGRHHMKGMR